MSSPNDPISDLGIGDTQREFRDGQRLFDRYLLKDILGRGGMGIVWRAFDEELNRDVALKFLPPEVALDEQAIKDLKRETTKSQELRHHHIVQVYDFVTDKRNKRNPCISMEYVDGPTLSAVKARKDSGCLEVEEITQWVKELCEALSYAHERAKIVHRDLKPANLMVNAKGELKVTDFGIARSVSDSVSMLTMARGVSGTLVYMSPQQLDGERASHLDDIYALGATLYELLTSRPPFYSGQVDRQIREKTPILMSARRAELPISNAGVIPREWEETVAACLAKDPALRPQSADEVAERLGIVTPRVSRATSPSGGSRDGTQSIAATADRREKDSGSRARKPLIIAAAFFLISGLAITLWFSRSHPSVPAPQQAESRTQPATSPLPVQTAPPAPVDSFLTVITRPPGAVLTVDDSEIGTTPMSGVKLTPGDRKISLSRIGFEPIEKSVEAVAGRTVDLSDVVLTRSTGSLQVRSDPNGQDYVVELIESPVPGENLATAGIQGALAGLTPAKLENVPTGVYRVTITRRGHRPQIQSITVSRRQTALAKTEFGPDTLEQSQSDPKPSTNSAKVSSVVEGALQESDMPAFLKKKFPDKDSFSGGVEQNGKQYYLISLPYHEAVYEVTAESVKEIASDDVMAYAIEKLNDKDLGLKLAIRSVETLIAREGREAVQKRLLQTLYAQTPLHQKAVKRLGFTTSK